MLPEVLSNGLCSLNPQVDRLCMVCEMTISTKGRLTGYKFYEAVMSSHARLTYTKVWHMLQGDQDLREQYAPLVKHIEELHNLYKTLDQAREERGGISFESEEAKFIFNAERRIERIEQTQRNDAHKLIEECMILANISAARFVEKAKEPALFRIHDKPSTEAITAFRSVLAELGLELPGGNKPEPRDYAELLESIGDRPDAEMLQTMLLRSMKQAIYDPETAVTSVWRCSLTPTLPRRSVVIRTFPCTARSSICWRRSRVIKVIRPKPVATIIQWKRCCNSVSTVPWPNVVQMKRRVTWQTG